MRYITSLAIAVFMLIACSTAALSFSKSLSLAPIASTFAQRPVTVRCYAPEESSSPSSLSAWGYVEPPIGSVQWLALDARLCAGAMSVNDAAVPIWKRALGVLVLVHESYHLRRYGGAGSEAKTECRAIRHWKVAAMMLGASPATIEELWPFALASHYRLADYLDLQTGERPYYDPGCDIPDLWTPPSP